MPMTKEEATQMLLHGAENGVPNCYFPQGTLYPDKIRDAMLERMYPTKRQPRIKKELVLVDGSGI
jgi:hypothetical protein